MSVIEEAIKSWETHRAGVIAEVENMPEAQLDYQIAPGARTFRQIAVHIAHAGVGFVEEIVKPDGTFMNLFNADLQKTLTADLPPSRNRTEIAHLLKTTGEAGAARLRQAGDRLAAETMATLGGPQTRLSGLWFAISHEMYHRGQLAIYGRGCGTVPALTQRIEAMLASRQ